MLELTSITHFFVRLADGVTICERRVPTWLQIYTSQAHEGTSYCNHVINYFRVTQTLRATIFSVSSSIHFKTLAKPPSPTRSMTENFIPLRIISLLRDIRGETVCFKGLNKNTLNLFYLIFVLIQWCFHSCHNFLSNSTVPWIDTAGYFLSAVK